MRKPMTAGRLREAREVAWNPAYRPSADFPEHVYHHDLLRDAVGEVERLRGTAGEWRSTAAVLHEILAEHRVMMQLADRNQAEPPKLVRDLMQWVATTVECEMHGQRERAEQAEADNARLRQELERLIPRTVACPVCQRQTKLTATGLIRHHGAHSRPCKGSGTHPVADAVAAPQRPVQSDVGSGCLCPHTQQPDGSLVRDGVLAVGCPVHDPDEEPACGG